MNALKVFLLSILGLAAIAYPAIADVNKYDDGNKTIVWIDGLNPSQRYKFAITNVDVVKSTTVNACGWAKVRTAPYEVWEIAIATNKDDVYSAPSLGLWPDTRPNLTCKNGVIVDKNTNQPASNPTGLTWFSLGETSYIAIPNLPKNTKYYIRFIDVPADVGRSANNCGMIRLTHEPPKLDMTTFYSYHHDAEYQLSMLANNVPPICKKQSDGSYVKLLPVAPASVTLTAWKANDGKVYIDGLVPDSKVKVTYIEIPKEGTKTVNACGWLSWTLVDFQQKGGNFEISSDGINFVSPTFTQVDQRCSNGVAKASDRTLWVVSGLSPNAKYKVRYPNTPKTSTRSTSCGLMRLDSNKYNLTTFAIANRKFTLANLPTLPPAQCRKGTLFVAEGQSQGSGDGGEVYAPPPPPPVDGGGGGGFVSPIPSGSNICLVGAIPDERVPTGSQTTTIWYEPQNGETSGTFTLLNFEAMPLASASFDASTGLVKFENVFLTQDVSESDVLVEIPSGDWDPYNYHWNGKSKDLSSWGIPNLLDPISDPISSCN